jgi:energy-coupling factor transport system substrate-specific component
MASEGGPESLDELALDLQELRRQAGNPSYSDIALAVCRVRVGRGVSPDEARPGRTTVYDAFRTGRSRLDLDLVLDIVRALGAEEPQVAAWRQRCLQALPGAKVREPDPAPLPAGRAPAREGRGPGRAGAAAILVGCVALNLLGRVVVDGLQIPLYLDMVGTAVAAVVLGPWRGAGVGVATNVLGVLSSGLVSLPFALVNVVGALVWGYGFRSFGGGRRPARFLALNIVVAVSCTVVAVPIVVLVGGYTGNGADSVMARVESAGHGLVLAVLSVNLLTSVADKLIAGFVALAALDLATAERTPRPPVGPTGA